MNEPFGKLFDHLTDPCTVVAGAAVAMILAVWIRDAQQKQPETRSLVEQFSDGKLIFIGISAEKPRHGSYEEGFSFYDECSGYPIRIAGGEIQISNPYPMPSVPQVLAIRKTLDMPQLGPSD